MKAKKIMVDKIISDYAEQYYKSLKEKGKLTPDEREKFLYWLSLHKMNKELQGMRPFVMGGYPKMMYDSITPYYQYIALIFIIVGVALLITSLSGFFYNALVQMTGYVLPSTLSLLFGIIILLFLKNLNSNVRR